MTVNRYVQRFAAHQAEGRPAFIPFTLLGWPNREASLAMVKTMVQAGVSALELGLAFSDPVADGPIIQQAATETLANGFTVDDAFALIREVRALDDAVPIGLLVYYNMVLARGLETFFRDAAAAGVDGVLIADLPPECAEEVAPTARRFGVAPIFIVSPLTTDERLDLITRYAEGFLYVVSRLGITGTEERYDETLQALLHRVKARTTLPLCVGFGISSPAQAQNMVALGGDGVITGSKIIQLARQPQGETHLQTFLAEMQAALPPGSLKAVAVPDSP